MLNKKKLCLFLCLIVYSAFASDFEKEEKNFLPYTSSSQVCVHVIPDELMLKILSALELSDLEAVRKVNKDFFRLTRDKSIVDSIFTDRLGKLINLVDKLPPAVKGRSRVGQWQYV